MFYFLSFWLGFEEMANLCIFKDRLLLLPTKDYGR